MTKYYLTELCAKTMAIKAPDSTVARKFLDRYEAMEREFKRMLIEQMETAKSENHKRIADAEIQKLEFDERRLVVNNRFLNIAERKRQQILDIKTAMGPLDSRDELLIKDAYRNVLSTITPPPSPIQTSELVLAGSAQTVATLAMPIVAPPPPPPPPKHIREWPLSAWLLEHDHVIGNLKQLKQLGTIVARKYRVVNGTGPLKRTSYVDGAVRCVNHYTDTDIPIIKAGIELMRTRTGWPPSIRKRSTLNFKTK